MLAKATDEILEKTAHIQILDISPPKKKNPISSKTTKTLSLKNASTTPKKRQNNPYRGIPEDRTTTPWTWIINVSKYSSKNKL